MVLNGVKEPGHWPLVMIMVLCFGSLILAVYLFQNTNLLYGPTNIGHLIDPVIPIARSEIDGLDEFSRQNIGEIRGRWVLVHIVTKSGCNGACRESLHKTKQVRLMLNKDLIRVRRLAIVDGRVPEDVAISWWRGHDYLLRAAASRRLIDIVRRVVGELIPEGTVVLMDPMGNFMMWYEAGFDPYGLKKDLKKLLYVSQVG